jgi:hypothetical protein
MLTVRTPVRSAPRTHEATSAMSAVCTCTSRVAGSEMSGALSPPSCRRARCTARRAPSAIIAQATSGCRFSAPNRLNDSFTTTRSAPARNGSASPAVCLSPVISPTGTPQASATRALMPLSPTRTPFSSTCEITEGLYVCESTELSPDIDPW